MAGVVHNGAVPDPQSPEDDQGLALRRDADAAETVHANRTWWDAQAPDYYAEHGGFLGDDDLVWGPEGWSEELLGLLGPAADLRDRDLLEIGGGAAQGCRWARSVGARVVSSDLSAGMLRQARAIVTELAPAGGDVDLELALLAEGPLELPVEGWRRLAEAEQRARAAAEREAHERATYERLARKYGGR